MATNDPSYAFVKEELAQILPFLYELRHDLHRHPEPSSREFYTAERIRQELSAIGLPWREVHGTGTLATLKGAHPGPVLLLRADIDALPVREQSLYPFPSQNEGFMHACGHDVHTTALMGASRILFAHRDELHGEVRFIFQQAEELGHGSQYFLRENVTADAIRIYGFHVCPEAPLGTVVLTDGTGAASVDHVQIKLYGKSAHIAKPHLANDCLTAAADIVLHLKQLKGGLDPMERVLVGVGRIQCGNTWNVVPDYAEMDGTIRALSRDARDEVLEKMRAITEQTAALYGVRAELICDRHGTCLVNDKEAFQNAFAAAKAALGDENALLRPVPLGFAGDDFSFFADQVKGCFFHVGTAIESREDSAVPLHSPNFYVDDRVIDVGCEVLTRCALAHLL